MSKMWLPLDNVEKFFGVDRTLPTYIYYSPEFDEFIEGTSIRPKLRPFKATWCRCHTNLMIFNHGTLYYVGRL